MAEEKKTAATEEESDEGSMEASDVNGRFAKLEEQLSRLAKAWEDEKKASAGKDKKISELVEAKKELQNGSLSKDKLLEVRQKELEEAKSEWEQQRGQEKLELEKLRIENERTKVIAKLENFPSFLIDRVRGTTPEEIEADARGMMNKWLKERDKVDNVRKLTGRPKSGNGKQMGTSVDELKEMDPKQKQKWGAGASKEEFLAMLEDMQKK